mgnify:CR=1 FL=1
MENDLNLLDFHCIAVNNRKYINEASCLFISLSLIFLEIIFIEKNLCAVATVSLLICIFQCQNSEC